MYVIYAPNLGTKQVSSGAERDYIRTKAPPDKNSPPGQKVPRRKFLGRKKIPGHTLPRETPGPGQNLPEFLSVWTGGALVRGAFCYRGAFALNR